MKQADPLARSAFLLAFDLRKGRQAGRGTLGYLLRAAALAELLLAGSLADDAGKARALAAPSGAPPGSLRAIVWKQIATSPPRSWRHWVGKDRAKAVRVVRHELAAERVIRVERHRFLGFPVERITLRKAYLSRRLAEQVSRAVRSGRPVARLDQDVRVLAALAVAAEVKGVPGEREVHRYRERVEQLSQPVEPVATALRKIVHAARGAEAAG
ncbi:GPP34 family phosphoprotein [Nonomuraea candida]|uniref:GPP34 family phosphoprotein n=1 Tax=Nonomuraea candida TaxID=359159 RepID=UPI0005BA0EBC|nr:GPP34 family phosphoprotein [Nonomuraea candida]